MRFPILAIALLVMCMACSACSSSLFGEGGTPVQLAVIEDVQVTPETVRAGDAVLISYRIGSQTVHSVGGFTLAVMPASLDVSAGDITPLVPAVYSPGGSLPDYLAANEAFTALSPFEFAPAQIWDAYQEPYFYMLYQAPSTAQEVEIEFWLGGGGGPSSSKARHTLKLEVH